MAKMDRKILVTVDIDTTQGGVFCDNCKFLHWNDAHSRVRCDLFGQLKVDIETNMAARPLRCCDAERRLEGL